MFRTVGDRPASWESLLPEELLRLPQEDLDQRLRPLPAAEPTAPPGRAYRLAERTRTRYAAVHELLARGLSRSAVSRELNLGIQTVRRSRTPPASRNCSARPGWSGPSTRR